MKKAICIVILAAVVLTLAAGCAQSEEPFRLHIIANSDSARDQEVKLKVRDSVLELTSDDLKICTSEKEAEKYVSAHVDNIIKCANGVLRENGMDYTARAEVGVFEFPDRVYGNVTYPAGDYYALRLILGEGEGQNWWCVMFPPLCIVNVEKEPENVEYRSLLLDFLSRTFSFDEFGSMTMDK